MPFYEYACKECDHKLEVLQKMNDPLLEKCPVCGKNSLKKLISATTFRLKGSGWYETDFKGNKKSEDSEKSDSSKKTSEKSDSSEKTSEKSDSSKKSEKKEKTNTSPAAPKTSASSASTGN
ncbi:MAG: zinc ribbon domain-containing protein [Thiomargarita sp.]|nr:zinc ribbon domain-containing protein [Thiomargarita sp.]